MKISSFLSWTGSKKCLKIFEGSGNHIEHASLAAWSCSKDGEKLVSTRTCNEMVKLRADIYNERKTQQNVSFWIGNSAPGESQVELYTKNWYKDGIIDS